MEKIEFLRKIYEKMNSNRRQFFYVCVRIELYYVLFKSELIKFN